MVMLVSVRDGRLVAQTEEATKTGAELVPSIIRDAGAKAVESYLCYFTIPRHQHNLSAPRKFLRWAGDANLTLDAIRAGHVADFFDGLLAERPASQTATVYFYATRHLFAHLEADRVIERNPFSGLKAPKALMSLKEYKECVRDLDGYEDGTEEFNATMVVFYPMLIGGMDAQKIASYTRLPVSEVEQYAARLRENGIWMEDGRIALSECSKDDASAMTIEIIIQVLCAIGHVSRTVEDKLYAK